MMATTMAISASAGELNDSIACNRIQSDIARYAELSQGVMQLTIIISNNVKRLPSATGIND
jgi:hypothetical protein